MMAENSLGARQPPATPALLAGFGKRVPQVRGDFTWVYIWGAPLRVMHWVAAACIVALAISGLYIGRPYFSTHGEASSHFLMGDFRFVHFLAATLLVMTAIVRAYWLFAGNQFERFTALFPVKSRDWKNMIRMGTTYLTLRSDKQPHFVGHNPMAQVSYTGIYLLAALMMLTGFTLYGQSDPDSLIFHAFGWLPPLLGGLQGVRFVHHVVTWAFLIFLPIHVYLAMRSDYLERGGVVSSIITGGRFVESGEKFEDYDLQAHRTQHWPEETR
jgi:Ni/Fe-hydrogenase b-type cytochrome subunit